MEEVKSQESVEHLDRTPITAIRKSADTSPKSVPIIAKTTCSTSLNRPEVPTETSSAQTSDVVGSLIEQLRDRAIRSQDHYTNMYHRIENFKVEPRPDGKPARKSAELTLMEWKYMLKGLCTVLNQAGFDSRNNVLVRNEAVITEEIELLKAADKCTIDMYTDLVRRRQRLLHDIESDLLTWEQQPFIRATRFLELGLLCLKFNGGDPEAANWIAGKGYGALKSVIVVHPPLLLKIFDKVVDINFEPGQRLSGEHEKDNNPAEHQRRSNPNLLDEAKEEEREAREQEQKALDR